MKELYVTPDTQFITFEVKDVIVTSESSKTPEQSETPMIND